MTRISTPTQRRIRHSFAAAVCLAAVMVFPQGATAAPEYVEIPLESGSLTVNGFTMNWPGRTETNARLIGQWDPDTGDLSVVLVSNPVVLSYPQWTGGEGTVEIMSANFVGTVLPGTEGVVTGTVSVEVGTNISAYDNLESVCVSSGEIEFAASIVSTADGLDLTLTATEFEFPFGGDFLDPEDPPCTGWAAMEATRTPTDDTDLTFTSIAADVPERTPRVVIPAALPASGTSTTAPIVLVGVLFIALGVASAVAARSRRPV